MILRVTARLWDDIVRRVALHRRVFECQRAAAAGIDAAAIARGVAGDDAAGDGECAFVVDTAALPRRVTEQRAVVDGQRAHVGDAATMPAPPVTEQRTVVDDKRARVLDGAAAVVAEGAASEVVEEHAVLDGERAPV